MDPLMCTHPPRDWIDILQAMLTPAIALLVATVGLAQWWIARNKFKLDMFDRRWVVWEATMKMISSMFSHAAVSDGEKDEFLKGIRGARWLLNERIDIYLKKELWPQICKLEATNMMLVEHAPQSGRDAAAKTRGEILEWTVQQYDVVDTLFDEFLQMDTPFVHWLKRKASFTK